MIDLDAVTLSNLSPSSAGDLEMLSSRRTIGVLRHQESTAQSLLKASGLLVSQDGSHVNVADLRDTLLFRRGRGIRSLQCCPAHAHCSTEANLSGAHN